jgi:divinyl chlorophyllide a 8-vinyl-reductase
MSKRVFLIGATGTIGRATLRALLDQGYDVVCFVRNKSALEDPNFHDAEYRFGDVTNPQSLLRDGFKNEKFNAIISTLASRTGLARDALAIDYQAHVHLLNAAQAIKIPHFILLSAICVQKPLLPFQHAKLAFETELMNSGLVYSIIRPTAFFKSLSGQVRRLQQGKPYIMFGDGRLTSCKPISDDDLARFIVDCVDDERRWNEILPIGGPGPAITPREQGELLFALLGRKPHFKSVPIGLLTFIQYILSGLGRFNQKLADKAELAAIGRYYATESMLVLNPATGRYDANATPSTGSETLEDYYERLIHEKMKDDRGDHAVF